MCQEKEKEGLISVIIPVYNVEKYLEQCVESVLTQSYKHIEVILIDDGSTDGSECICDAFERRDSRVKVIHQKNGGAAAAKNAGLRAATGKYLSFVDSDDYLEPGVYSYMVNLLEESRAEVVECSYRDVFCDVVFEHAVIENRKEVKAEEYLGLYTKKWTCGLLWDKLYLRSIFENIYFEEGHKIDDEYFTYQGIMNSSKIIMDSKVMYNYRKRKSSVMYAEGSARQILEDRIDYLNKRRVKVINRFPKLRSQFDTHFVEMMIILSQDDMMTKQLLREIRNQLTAYMSEKQHTKINVRLWPSLMKIYLGLDAKKKQKPEEDVSMDRYFD